MFRTRLESDGESLGGEDVHIDDADVADMSRDGMTTEGEEDTTEIQGDRDKVERDARTSHDTG